MSDKIKQILDKYKNCSRDQLIPLLQEVQDNDGYISRGAVVQIGEHLDLPASKIYGVATFYNQFRFEAKGKHHILICRGTACHVKSSLEILKSIEEELGIKAGNTTRDGLFSIEVVACLGACGLAPLINVSDEFYGSVTTESVKEIIRTYRRKEENYE